jgi:hypothetical protein
MGVVSARSNLAIAALLADWECDIEVLSLKRQRNEYIIYIIYIMCVADSRHYNAE